jgi:hypothetical protein
MSVTILLHGSINTLIISEVAPMKIRLHVSHCAIAAGAIQVVKNEIAIQSPRNMMYPLGKELSVTISLRLPGSHF